MRLSSRFTSSSTLASSEPNERDSSVGAVEHTRLGILNGEDAIRRLEEYHPIVIEGMGYYDPRDPYVVSDNICATLQAHFASRKPNKPLLVFVQGDPLSERGISAITPLVAKCLTESQRGLVCLDPSIDPTHSQNADRDNILLEVRYSQLVHILSEGNGDGEDGNSVSILQSIEDAIDAILFQKNTERLAIGKPPLKDYFKQYALLQEVTKGALKHLCNELTIVHTSSEINPFSVTSFYEVGLSLGLYDEATNMVAYKNHRDGEQEVLDFLIIDNR